MNSDHIFKIVNSFDSQTPGCGKLRHNKRRESDSEELHVNMSDNRRTTVVNCRPTVHLSRSLYVSDNSLNESVRLSGMYFQLDALVTGFFI